MNKLGDIIVIDDDEDDLDLLRSIFQDLKLSNPVSVFANGREALDYISRPAVAPFLILSDINMAFMSGFELREIVRNDPDLDIKCIPYIFFTNGASRQFVEKAYSLSVQGIFEKPPKYDKWKDIIKEIVAYWSDCMSPGRY